MTDPDATYKVNLDVYSGPLELLLFLIRKEEVDIKDIPIAHITNQYLQHVEIIRKLDINLAGEFLVMAATLMEIKSRMLIPRPAPNPDDPAAASTVEDFSDPRQELVRQLLAYKAFKDAAADLRRRGQTESRRFPRAISRHTGKAPLDIEDLSLFALIDAFYAIMSSIGHSPFGHEIIYDDTPISLHQADILDRLQRQTLHAIETGQADTGLTLRDLFTGHTKKNDLIGLFLAVLELIRQKQILVDQPELLGDVRIRLRDDSQEPPAPLATLSVPLASAPYEVPSTPLAPHSFPHLSTSDPDPDEFPLNPYPLTPDSPPQNASPS